MRIRTRIGVTGFFIFIVALSAQARVVNFDFDDGESDVEFFAGTTAKAEIDLAAHGRVQVQSNVWMSVRVTDSEGTPIPGHVNDAGLGGVGGAGANQFSGGERMVLSFYDAAAGGDPASVDLAELVFGNFGGTAGETDGIIVQVGALPDIVIAANTNSSGAGYVYTELGPAETQGTGRLLLDPAVALTSITLIDHSTGSGGSRLNLVRFGGSVVEPPPVGTGPNVIYIIADDLGYSDPGCYGGEIHTPNIDRLAAAGVRFRHFYDCAKCETSRSALMSGLYHGRCGLQVQNGTTLGEAMQSAGYRTYAVGKWHLGDTAGKTPTDRGFNNYYGHYSGASSYFPIGIGANDIYLDTQEPDNFISAYSPSYFTQDSSRRSRETSFPPGFYLTDAFGDHAVEFLDDAVDKHTNRPFFMYVAFNAPHTPLQAPVEEINKYRHTYTNGWDVMRQEKWQRQLASGLVDPQWQLSNLRDDIPRWDDLDAAARDAEDHRRAVFAAMVDRMDQNIGKILDRLDELDATTRPGILTNTLVVFTSDNGAQAFDNASEAQRQVDPDDPDSKWNEGPAWAAFSNTPWRYYKQSQQQGGVCAPFVARWPGTIAPGRTTDQPGHVVDVMATLVDIAKVDYASLTTYNGNPVPPLDGASLMPIFTGGTRPAPDFWGFEFNNSEFAVIQGDWKLAAFSSSPWRLFNLRDDRTETRNLRWDNPQKVHELAALYDQWAIDTYGNTTRTYAKRDTLDKLGQELRYETVQTGKLYSEPSVGITVTNMGSGASSTVDDHWEIVVFDTSATGIGGTADDITFACQPFFGDGEIIAQVDSISNALAAGHAGVMVRETLDADSAFVMTGLKPNGQLVQFVRDGAGHLVSTTTGATGIAAPVFLRVERTANVFTSSFSTNEYDWVDFASATNAMGASAQGGLAAASGGSAGTIIFREWDNLDIAEYPGQLRTIDGLPALMGYALGADEQTDATDRLPSIHMTNEVSAIYPELSYTRRVNPDGLLYGILGGSAPGTLGEDSTNWTEVAAVANPDGTSERVVFKRAIGADSMPQGFFRLYVRQE
jgi:arylsulfatase A-like enzyme